MFNRESGLVQVWVNLVKQGLYTKELVPKLSNLQDIVFQILKEEE